VKEVNELRNSKDEYGIEPAAAAPYYGCRCGGAAAVEKRPPLMLSSRKWSQKLQVVKVVKDITGLGLKLRTWLTAPKPLKKVFQKTKLNP
jgi:large subunit ribosomal protein L7/L12